MVGGKAMRNKAIFFLLSSTSTLHVRTAVWALLGAMIFLSLGVTLFFWMYCSDSEYDTATEGTWQTATLVKAGRCPIGNGWDEEFWGAPMCTYGYCERCYMEDYIRSRANSYSNIAMIINAFIIATLGEKAFHRPVL